SLTQKTDDLFFGKALLHIQSPSRWGLDSKSSCYSKAGGRRQDKQATRKACERFRTMPVSVMNFVEGTRFTEAKHATQESPYANLLRPRAGGVAFVLETMGDMLQSIVDVTIVYPAGRPTFVDLLANRVPEIRVRVQQLPIPPEFVGHDYENDAEFRSRFQAWISEQWTEKDALIAQMRQESAR
ncbi:acetyltransferase, partial [Rudaea sp.]|uniref:acetyltransferase n=1 Tax=Rudaea sp. TaxID=2136325 RepID=UPI0032202EA0